MPAQNHIMISVKATILTGILTVCLHPFTPLAKAQERLPAREGRELVTRICTSCHGWDEISSLRSSRSEWTSTVADMADKGAEGTKEEFAQVVDYLALHFGKLVNVNDATADEIQSGLSLTQKDAEAIVNARREKGTYRDLQDLLKVPGVDAAKIEEQKDNLAF